MSEYLPEEVLVQILSRLPVKSIIKFTCVSKLWNSIIKSSHFISTFSSNKHRHYILLRNSYASYQYSLRFDNKDFDEYLSVHPPFNLANTFHVPLVGSSNGLVCLYRISLKHFIYNEFIIWNPSIRKSVRIPESNFCLPVSSLQNLFGFGFDSRTNDYKLLMFSIHAINDAVLYSLNSNTWKKVTNFAYKQRNTENWVNYPAFVDGRFYWFMEAEKKNMVLVFDLRNEMFGEISLPEDLEDARDTYLKIKAFGESSIAVIHKILRDGFYESDIWVMKEYNSGAWMKLATVGNRSVGSSEVMEFRDNGEVLVGFYTGGLNVASYNLKNGRIKNFIALRSVYGFHYAYRHVESLALLDKGDNILISHSMAIH